jgi:hypothetical protein
MENETFTYTFDKNEINLIQLVLSNNVDYLMQEYKGNVQDKELIEKWLNILDKIETPMKEKNMLWQTTKEYYMKEV